VKRTAEKACFLIFSQPSVSRTETQLECFPQQSTAGLFSAVRSADRKRLFGQS
jgi:hypothetical protein